MKLVPALLASVVIGGVSARAVYAPIPELQQGKALSVNAGGGVGYDTNLFGARADEIASTVYSAYAEIIFNASVTDQTFASGSYRPSLDYMEKRPGEKSIDSHRLNGRVAHSFSPDTSIDVTDSFEIQSNPESLLAGLPVNTDQSYQRNQFDARFSTAVTPKGTLIAKARHVSFAYDNATLATAIDRAEALVGLEGTFLWLPEIKLASEYRHQFIRYDANGGQKDKDSDYFLVGSDYTLAKKITATGRLGLENRERDGGGNSTAPYVELSSRYDLGTNSFVSAGYVYTLEETSNVALYTDIQVHRLFVNAQKTLSPSVVASGSATYEPSSLQGRRGQSTDRDETTVRLGAALTYLASKNWSATVSYDFDDVESDDLSRGQTRERVSLNGRYAF